MTHKEIEGKKERLVKIQREDYKGDQMDDLRKLALEVGASRYRMYHLSGGAGQAELVDHIYQALQTASMIETCRIANENYEIAVTATKAAIKNYWIAAAIAILAMLAAWAAVFVTVLIL